jgi:hypothetical protein
MLISASAALTLVVGASIAVLVVGAILMVFAFGRVWPGMRQQGDRLRRSGGPRGADFDTVAARWIDRMPTDLSRRDPNAEDDASPSR